MTPKPVFTEPGSIPRIRTRRDYEGSLPEPHLINLPPLGAILRLVVRARRIVRSGDAALGAELGLDQRRGDFEVLAMVGDVDRPSPIHQLPPDLLQHLGTDDAALLFLLPRPGFGKVDVQLGDRGVGDHVAQDEERVVVDEAHVRQMALEHAVADDAVVVQRFLDADQVVVGVLGRGGDEKSPLARADLDEDGARVAEPLREVEAMEARVARIEDQVRFVHAARTLSHASATRQNGVASTMRRMVMMRAGSWRRRERIQRTKRRSLPASPVARRCASQASGSPSKTRTRTW